MEYGVAARYLLRDRRGGRVPSGDSCAAGHSRSHPKPRRATSIQPAIWISLMIYTVASLYAINSLKSTLRRGAIMVSRHRGHGARRAQSRPSSSPTGRQNRPGSKNLPAEDFGCLPEDLSEAIELERDNLSKAESVLACMAVSLKFDTDPLQGPYYPAVVQVVRELVGR